MTPDRLKLEQEIVWAALGQTEQFARHAHELAPEMFSDPRSRKCIMGMHRLLEKGVEINVINLDNVIDEPVVIPETAAVGYGDIGVASKRLTELYILDRKAELTHALMEEDDPFGVINAVNRSANEFASLIGAHSRLPKSVIISDYLDVLERNANGHILRVPTGFPTLDAWSYGGLKLGNMSFLGGGPGIGKTSFMLKMGLGASERGHETAFLEGEMPMDEILTRLNGIHSNLPVHEIEAGKHLKQATEFCDHLNFIQYSLQSTFERNVTALMGHIREAIHNGAKLIFVDYLQVFVDKNGRAQDEFAKIKALSEGIRKMTLINNVHICAASSLNRLEAGATKLTLNSFYGGSQLGHDCNTAIILTENEDQVPVHSDFRVVTVDIVKNRGGRTGPFNVLYNLPTQDMVEQANVEVAGVPQGRLFPERDEEPF